MIQVLNQNGNLEDKTTQKDINKALITEFKKKFHQTDKTPLITYPIVHELGYLGLSEKANDILNGHGVLHPQTDTYSQLLFQELKKTSSTPISTGIKPK